MNPVSRTHVTAAVLVFTLAIAACAAAQAPSPSRGHLVLVGGGAKPEAAMRKFIELAGGTDAPIVVIPTASGDEDTPQYYLDLFRDEFGATDVVVLPIREKADAERPEVVAAAARGRGFWFAGGDQNRVTRALLGTPVLEVMREAFERGVAIGGTSAGTACQSALMITGEGNFDVIREGSVELVEGLGFLDDVIVDQHFLARRRHNRLLAAVLQNPAVVGVGIDEDTAAWFRPDGTFEVIGDGSVMVIDARGSEVSEGKAVEEQPLLGARGMRLHIVLPGEVFDPAESR